MPRVRTRNRLVLGLAVLTAITALVLFGDHDRGVARSFRVAVQDVAASIDDDVARIIPFHSTNRKTTQTGDQTATSSQDQLRQAQAKAATAQDLERQLKELQSLAKILPPQNIANVGARVVATGASNYKATVEIDRGHDGGVSVGNPVMSPTGLVGRVVQTSSNRATVLLLCDASSNVGVRTPSGEIAVAVGEGVTPGFHSKPLRLDYVDANAQINTGDTMVTSGLQRSLYPPGLPIGVVASVSSPKSDARKAVTVDLFIVPSRLDAVTVLQWKP